MSLRGSLVVEHQTHNLNGVSSILTPATTRTPTLPATGFALLKEAQSLVALLNLGCGQVVRHLTVNQDSVGSIPTTPATLPTSPLKPRFSY